MSHSEQDQQPSPPTSGSPEPKTRSRGSATKVLVGFTVIASIAFLGAAGGLAWMLSGDDSGDVAEGSVLTVSLGGLIADAPTAGGLVLDPEDLPILGTEMAAALKQAAEDDRIEGVFLNLKEPVAGWGMLSEIRDGLVAVTDAGKPCVAYAETYSTKSYFLATACEQVILAPGGLTMVNGFGSSITYYADTFEKLGIEPEFEHVGDFKSAIEPYERTGPSEPAAEAMDHLLDGLYEHFVSSISGSRGWTVDQAKDKINHPALSPNAALEDGWVDALAFPASVLAQMPEGVNETFLTRLSEPVPDSYNKEFRKEHYTPLSEYIKDVRVQRSSGEDKVAVVFAEGPIMSGSAEGGLFASQILADKTFASWMDEVRNDDEVKSVVIRVNSPGGSGLASDMMWHQIVRTKARGKHVVVSMGDYAASGGYYIAAPADYIVAQPTTLTGSIGVFGGKMNLSGSYEKLGMHSHAFKRGEESDLFSPNAGFSDNGRVVYKRFLQDFYEKFLSKVTQGRSMTRDQAHAVAQGRVWTGSQALEHGLVDELGGLDVAVAKAAELASIDDPGIRRWPRQKDFFEMVMEDLKGNARLKVDLGLPVETQVFEEIGRLDAMLKDGAVVLLPGNLTID